MTQIESPLNRDFLLIGSDQSGDALPCDHSGIADISCIIAPSFFYIEYPVTNCLLENTVVSSSTRKEEEKHLPLYYFYKSSSLIPVNQQLCGESWSSIYHRTRPYLWCDEKLQLYIREKPWYETALLATAAYMNGRRDALLWLTLETLERTCSSRETAIPLEETIFFNMSEGLRVKNPTYSMDSICEWLMDDENLIYNITLPVYLEHEDQWYFKLFQYIVIADENMRLVSILLFILPFIILTIILIALSITIYHVYRKRNYNYQRVE
jgi:hypothetical protein